MTKNMFLTFVLMSATQESQRIFGLNILEASKSVFGVKNMGEGNSIPKESRACEDQEDNEVASH